MANITFPSSSSSMDNPVVSAASSSSGAPEDAFEDGCSICLEPFTTADPATITSCKHEYHLHCILEWSQRSEDCPICCQSVVLKDPASQGLLAAVEIERRSRSRNISSAAPTSLRHFCEDFSVEHHMAAAAASRARYVSRREMQRSSGIGPSQVLVFTSPENTSQKTYATSPENFQNLSYVSPQGDSLSGIPSAINIQPPSSVDVNLVSSAAVNRDIPFKPRLLHSQPPPDTPRRPSASEIFSFPETLKSKLSAASARYKESISKGTRGFKEKLLARNGSVKELSKGVQREMTAGIAGVARMIERLDLSSKRTGSSVPVSSCTVGPSNLSFKGKGVEDKVDAQSLDKNSGLIADDLSPDTTYISGAIPAQPEIPHAQSG
ncbi:E3 ubiquitin-protein ligase RHF1A isoform X2 [Alnus glutinosa]|uniref:E3 ubiquitin-protein ligase RHF1A isoform X2 n=1 Tax=Alnus glutinosa TaxID=3517 RepID=UPI002D7A14E1|nr:E3 ubiquitin-protein ligase RHF1A isoform X2 [Alnus glutinosa]